MEDVYERLAKTPEVIFMLVLVRYAFSGNVMELIVWPEHFGTGLPDNDARQRAHIYIYMFSVHMLSVHMLCGTLR